jgi:type II secretory pathway pseudopilin PulG
LSNQVLNTMAFSRHPRSTHGRQDGYVLLTLMLMVTLMIMVAAAALPSISFEIRRDREQEMIHRGVQYSRAIRSYYRKFGRYPNRLEDLENTNNLRFLRKRYKDPITGQDFKILRYGDVKMTLSGLLPGSGSPGINGASPLNGSVAFGEPPQPAGSGFGGPTGFGAASRPSASADSSTSNQNQATDPNQTGDTAISASAASPASPSAPGQPGPPPGTSSPGFGAGQTLGGLPIVGVTSTSKKATIREFNHKRKYNEWQFIFDPATGSGLLTTPNQPQLQGFGNQPGQTLQQGNSAQQGNFTGTTVGPIPGMLNNPNPGMQDTPPPQPPNQQQ